VSGGGTVSWENQRSSSQQLRDVSQLLRSGSSDVISRLVRDVQRVPEKDVKSTSRGEEFQEEFVLP